MPKSENCRGALETIVEYQEKILALMDEIKTLQAENERLREEVKKKERIITEIAYNFNIINNELQKIFLTAKLPHHSCLIFDSPQDIITYCTKKAEGKI